VVDVKDSFLEAWPAFLRSPAGRAGQELEFAHEVEQLGALH
jgi:hypothetical protein